MAALDNFTSNLSSNGKGHTHVCLSLTYYITAALKMVYSPLITCFEPLSEFSVVLFAESLSAQVWILRAKHLATGSDI